MKKVDRKEAKLRIAKALVSGHVDVYGMRRIVEGEREVMASPGRVWKADEKWTDPSGVERTGRFVNLPPVKCKQKFTYPQGVIPAEVADWSRAVMDGFMELLTIIEEALDDVPADEAREIISEMRKAGC